MPWAQKRIKALCELIGAYRSVVIYDEAGQIFNRDACEGALSALYVAVYQLLCDFPACPQALPLKEALYALRPGQPVSTVACNKLKETMLNFERSHT